MEKHAYLIMAHNEFKVLELLVAALDDQRNDIYIHFDAKCKSLPNLKCKVAGLYIVSDRTDVRWGDYSIIEAELSLFECAFKSQPHKGVNYLYYHLLSGVDIPLKSQNYIHDFFNKNQGKEFLGYFQGGLELELQKKVQIYHLFPKHFSKERCMTLYSVVRAFFCRFQLFFGFKRNKDVCLVRGTQWVSITNDFVEYILSRKKEIWRRFHHTFCADEVYKHSLCWNSDFKDRIYNPNNEALGCMREINWVISDAGSFLPSFTMVDLERLQSSPMLFARKFDELNIDVVNKIIAGI